MAMLNNQMVYLNLTIVIQIFNMGLSESRWTVFQWFR